MDYLLDLSGKLGKKSYQSRVFVLIAYDLIEAGVSEGNSLLIDQGVNILDRVVFRKYRSDIMIEIIPLLIVWAITKLDENLLYRSLKNIEEISDISKRAVLHAELAKAIATIAILKKDNILSLGKHKHRNKNSSKNSQEELYFKNNRKRSEIRLWKRDAGYSDFHAKFPGNLN